MTLFFFLHETNLKVGQSLQQRIIDEVRGEKNLKNIKDLLGVRFIDTSLIVKDSLILKEESDPRIILRAHFCFFWLLKAWKHRSMVTFFIFLAQDRK